MRFFKAKDFGEIKAFELGWSPWGRPFMNVHIYLVGPLCIDTGQSHMRREALAVMQSRPLEAVVLTHHHEDHSGNAAAISRASGVPVLGHALAVDKMARGSRILPYQHYVWGRAEPLRMAQLPENFDAGGYSFEVVPCPGHSRDHIALFERQRGWLFSGDIYLADRINYFRADENIYRQIDSLRRLLELDFDKLFCAHRPRLQNGKKHLSAKLGFLEDLAGSVSELGGRGLEVGAIMRELSLREDKLVWAACGGNVSMRNLVRSALNDG